MRFIEGSYGAEREMGVPASLPHCGVSHSQRPKITQISILTLLIYITGFWPCNALIEVPFSLRNGSFSSDCPGGHSREYANTSKVLGDSC
jgi:hypothetical protein